MKMLIQEIDKHRWIFQGSVWAQWFTRNWWSQKTVIFFLDIKTFSYLNVFEFRFILFCTMFNLYCFKLFFRIADEELFFWANREILSYFSQELLSLKFLVRIVFSDFHLSFYYYVANVSFYLMEAIKTHIFSFNLNLYKFAYKIVCLFSLFTNVNLNHITPNTIT